jgi:hypothetical protein
MADDSTSMAAMAGTVGMDSIGFAPPLAKTSLAKRQNIGIELFATAALAICLIVAATAVSIGAKEAHGRRVVGGGSGAGHDIALSYFRVGADRARI